MGSLGERMTQCGVGPCNFQNSSGNFGLWCSSPFGAHVSKGGKLTCCGCAEQSATMGGGSASSVRGTRMGHARGRHAWAARVGGTRR